MKFQHSAFIRRNTPELRKKLEDLGYGKIFKDDNNYPYLVTEPLDNAYCDRTQEQLKSFPDAIDCGTNESLFLAIAAIREDSDYMQWFINDFDMTYQDNNTGKWKETKWFIWRSDNRCLSGRKASPKELEEHFKEM